MALRDLSRDLEGHKDLEGCLSLQIFDFFFYIIVFSSQIIYSSYVIVTLN